MPSDEELEAMVRKRMKETMQSGVKEQDSKIDFKISEEFRQEVKSIREKFSLKREKEAMKSIQCASRDGKTIITEILYVIKEDIHAQTINASNIQNKDSEEYLKSTGTIYGMKRSFDIIKGMYPDFKELTEKEKRVGIISNPVWQTPPEYVEVDIKGLKEIELDNFDL